VKWTFLAVSNKSRTRRKVLLRTTLTRRRWIADESSGDTAALTGEHARHLARVLRAEVGQEFDIGASGMVRRGKIVSVCDERVEFVLGDTVAGTVAAQVTLVLAIFKFDRMEWAIEKCTELGIARIIPVVARRTDLHLASSAVKRCERWRRIARQAAEQSRQATPPEVAAPVNLKDLNTAVPAASAVPATDMLRIVLAESEENARIRDVVGSGLSGVTFAVGPEGGWTEDELLWFRNTGWKAASLGHTILRAETAAIVATALAHELSDKA
jgi:16S rRNA (uracil1498-N3)-methyltransferase